MANFFTAVLKTTPLYDAVVWWRARRALRQWNSKGCPDPPPSAYKYSVIQEYGRRFGLRVLVETGTFLGEALFACRRSFDRLYSIELSESLYEEAVRRFRGNRK